MILTNAQMMASMRILAKAEEKGALGLAIARNRQKLAQELQEYSAKYDELLKKHGTEVEPGCFSITAETFPAFNEELRPYAEMAADVPVCQVSEEVFCSGDLTSSQMITLGWMVREG